MDLRNETSQIVCVLLGSENRERSHRVIIEMLQNGELEPDQWIASDVPGYEFTLLPAAIERGWTDLAVFLIGRGVKLDRRIVGWTPLMLACQFRNQQVIEALIAAGAKVNLSSAKGEDGQTTALMEAAGADDLWAVKRLLAAGADARFITPRKQTAAYFPMRRGRSEAAHEIVRQLVAAGCPLLGNELHFPIYRRDVETTKLLLACSCPSNTQFDQKASNGPEKGQTPLATAAESNAFDSVAGGLKREPTNDKRLEIVRALLAAGADPNAPGAKGWTPLMLAVLDNNLDIAKLLLGGGADPNYVLPSFKLASPVALAANRKLDDFIRIFEKGRNSSNSGSSGSS
jgi:ankyrin repeat protein